MGPVGISPHAGFEWFGGTVVKRRHAKAIREVAEILDRRLAPITSDHRSEHSVEVVEGREPVIRITIRVKS